MKAVVKDACVLIDLIEGSILDSWLYLKIETWVTDLVLRELEQNQHDQVRAYIESSQINLRVFTADELLCIEAMRLEAYARGLSPEDLSCLYLAQEDDMILLSGDGTLRKRAAALSIEIRGTLWILERLVEAQILAPAVAAAKLTYLLECGRRFPDTECKKLISKWHAS